jgi:hypothetical protein
MEDLKVIERRAAELEVIRNKTGGALQPADVVKFARNPKTALHGAFCWDDGEAAEQYRLWQARQVIRVCVTVREEVEGPPVRAYVSLQEDRGDVGYRLLDDVMSDEEMREQLLAQALAELNRWKVRYQQLRELAPVFEAAENVSRRTRKPKGRSVGGKTRKVRVAAAMA